MTPSDKIIAKVNPKIAQLSGGTEVVVAGYIPDVGVNVDMERANGNHSLPYHVE